MRDRLPVHIENRELPKDFQGNIESKSSYGYVSILYLTSILITITSVLVVVFLGK